MKKSSIFACISLIILCLPIYAILPSYKNPQQNRMLVYDIETDTVLLNHTSRYRNTFSLFRLFFPFEGYTFLSLDSNHTFQLNHINPFYDGELNLLCNTWDNTVGIWSMAEDTLRLRSKFNYTYVDKVNVLSCYAVEDYDNTGYLTYLLKNDNLIDITDYITDSPGGTVSDLNHRWDADFTRFPNIPRSDKNILSNCPSYSLPYNEIAKDKTKTQHHTHLRDYCSVPLITTPPPLNSLMVSFYSERDNQFSFVNVMAEGICNITYGELKKRIFSIFSRKI